jgi:DNA-binding transcriptional ArsR family regulator
MDEGASINRYQLAEVGSLIAEPARAAMLLALIDGTARPAGELVRIAGIGAATASAHLKRLMEGGLLGVHVQGRHRYYRLANDDIAAWMEAMALPRTPLPVRPGGADAALRRARTCYRHIAGRLGVSLCSAGIERAYIHADAEGLRLLPAGAEALHESGLQSVSKEKLLRLSGRGCLDWTERRMHLGGSLGVAIAGAMLEAGWLRHAQQGRALVPSADGLRHLGELGVRLDD